jgi:hypothetical protein
MIPPKCPHCARKGDDVDAEIMKVVSAGVAFKCPNHGSCGLRFDSMTEQERDRLLPQGAKTPRRYP